jgi:hypothetical protein
MALAGWTNDRLVAERVARLPREDWVHGRPNASIVMAAFLHVPPGGNRFNGPDLGAWYAATAFPTAAAEVAHHLRREAVATAQPIMRRQYRMYQARLDGVFLDIRGERDSRPEVYDPRGYTASQVFGEAIRAAGGGGIVWDSLRHRAAFALFHSDPEPCWTLCKPTTSRSPSPRGSPESRCAALPPNSRTIR